MSRRAQVEHELVSGQLRALARVVSAHTYRVDSERELHEALARVLQAADVPFVREPRISASDRPDFLVAGDLALEAKIKGSATELTRQVARYADHPHIAGILAVSTRRLHDELPASLSGKPIAFALARRFV